MQIFRRSAIAACAWVSLAGLAHAAPSLTLSPKFGPPTTKVTAKVDGFDAGSTVNVSFDAVNQCAITADGSGAGSCAFAVPASALPQKHSVAAKQASSTNVAKKFFLVRTDWGQAHGITTAQNGLNKYENIITPANAATLALHWNVLSGVTISGPPVVVGNRVYVTGEDASTNYNLYAFNVADGTPVSGFPKINVSGLSPSISLSPPAVANGSVYVATRNGGSSQLFAFNAANGAQQSGYPVGLDHSAIPEATIGGGNVYQPAGYKIFAFDAKTGLGLPNYPITAPNKFISAAASLAAVKINGTLVNELCVGSADNTLYCFDAATGDQLFKVQTSGFFNNGGPAVSGGVIYFISWGDHKLRAIDAATGAAKWPSPLSLTYASNSTPAVANGQVVIGDHGGTLYSVKATDGTVKWSKQPDALIGQAVTPLDGSAIIADGIIYVNSTANLFAINANTGAVLWHTPNAGSYNLTPVVVNGTVFAVSPTAGLSAFTLNGASVASRLPGGDMGVVPADSALKP